MPKTTDSVSGSSHPSITALRTDKVIELLTKIPDFDFPIFDLHSVSAGRPLTVIGHYLVVESGLLERLGLPLDKFMQFLESVESSYDSSLSCTFFRKLLSV